MTQPGETLDHLDGPTRALVVLAAAIATGREPLVEEQCRACVFASVPALWVDELLLQSLLMVGWPFSLLCKIKSTAESERPTSRSMTASPLIISS